MRRKWIWIGGLAAALLVLLLAVDYLIDEPMRKRMERELNSRLKGYSVRIGALDYHLWGFSVDLEDSVISQDAHPDPPVATIPKLSASVQWRQLLRAKLVANFRIDNPRVHFDQNHFEKEQKDPVPIEERGWQEALQAIYPLTINEFKIVDGELTYIDKGPFEPIKLRSVNFTAGNIRNIKSETGTYPSDVHLDAVIFESGKVVVDGHADFLATPHAAVKADVKIENIELRYFQPITTRYNVSIRRGVVSTNGVAEYAPSVKVVDLKELAIRDPQIDWVRTAQTAAAGREQQVGKQTAKQAKELSNDPAVIVRVDKITVTNGDFGFVNRAAEPDYRAFISSTDLTATKFSNQATDGTSTVSLKGKFMGTGDTRAGLTLRPRTKSPDFDLHVRIEDTQMPAMNKLLRAHGKLDVTEGLFSFYSELAVRNNEMRGYIKPLFQQLNVYDPRQDKEKGVFKKLYERLVEGVSKVLENMPRDEVATKADISGKLDNPQANTLEVIIRLVQNAFFKAILPGFDQQSRPAKKA